LPGTNLEAKDHLKRRRGRGSEGVTGEADNRIRMGKKKSSTHTCGRHKRKQHDMKKCWQPGGHLRVDVVGVREVVVQVGDGALAGHDGLDEEAKAREHGEAAVLDLLDLELGKGVGVVGQAEGVEGTAGVQGRLAAVDELGAVRAIPLREA
jgi:hypothetical protein